ncbi:hypothetical protein RCH06_000255 [Polaromonas sp. CG_9.5]|uniref:hypothetical protein n=1 Tax=Polaromonas sp. CG_9.5 TaxID=3071705 RepID=UPI002E04FCBE|nr:hypothetical protein [Polaromonas sp. CG_9.5]
MLLPPLTDLVALLGIDLVLYAAGLRLLTARHGVSGWGKWVVLACSVLLWLPVGAAQLPLLAYVRGISSDLSVTLVALSCLGLAQRLFRVPVIATQERMALNGVIVLGALFLYPLALGWGNWDAYRLGWGSWGMWAALLALSLVFWIKGLRLLPLLIGLALLAWTAGLMESTNLWDYLIDPWLAVAAFFQCMKAGAQALLLRFRPARAVSQRLSS